MSVYPAPDRRAHPRYLCWVEVLCETGLKHRPARLLNLSSGGASVALLAPVPAGIDLRLVLPHGESGPSLLAATVNRVSRTNTGWEAGCTFSPALTDEQLVALLSSLDEAGVGASPSKS
jgi:hypothetical protein